jgi:hypothetical protein
VVKDINVYELVNRTAHKHQDLDWREVQFIRFGKHLLSRDAKDPSLVKWSQLSKMFKCSQSWLYRHCNTQLKLAFSNSDDYTIDLRAQPLAALKLKPIFPKALVRFVSNQKLMQDQCDLSLAQRCSNLKLRFKIDLEAH